MKIDVIPGIKTTHEVGVFSYLVPNKFQDKVRVGTIVKIPFGKRQITGVVEKISNDRLQISNKYKLKTILDIVNEFVIPKEYLKIAKWISEYYLCSLGEAISIFLPPILKNPRHKIQDTNKSQISNHKQELNPLTTEQKKIFEKISKHLISSKKKPALIYGVTGSGKTELYLALAKETIDLGKSVILLVPEIVLTPQNIERFEEIFSGEICIMHSHLSKSERLRCYHDFYLGKKKIVIGPRSALLIPSNNIGLIIIDEEQEESYKQQQNPRYDAITLAEKIAQEKNALLVLGSATPRIETFYKAKSGKYDLFTLSVRYNLLTLPSAEIVDLKNEIKRENFSPISEKLEDALKNVLKNHEQAILFLNRRGMSTFISCRDCGEIIYCKNCDVPMVFHFDQRSNYIICHHCGKRDFIPTKCPKCGSAKIKYFGSGVEKIEAEIQNKFPKARIKRVDAKVLRNNNDYEDFYQDFNKHRIDIVIGTQILAKGFDIPDVSLVGIVSADVGLHLPYFRASEKIFRLITQVSGRSGRRNKAGRTIIQTYWPNSLAIKFAAKHDYLGFYKEEIKKRLAKKYPPKMHIIRVLSEHRIQNTAKQQIEKLNRELQKQNIDFVGPGPCFFQRLHNRFRYQIIIKINKLPDKKITDIQQDYQNFVWDVDAIDLL